MRARVLIVAGLVTSLAAACSRPSTESPAAEDEAARDISLVPTADGPAVLSALEAPAPAPAPEPARSPAREARGAPQPIGQASAPVPTPAVHDHAQPAEQAALTTHPRMDDSGERESGPSDRARGGGKPAVPMTDGAGPVPDQGRGPILVRGGEASIHDDCAKHMPPRVGDVRPEGNAGVLINDRTPRRGPPQNVADRTPTTRGPTSFGGRGGIR